MQFPKTLEKKGRKKLSEKVILPFHYLYSRHKSISEWKEGEEFPDFNQIKVDQSFNWSAFSYPVWVRFNPEKEYMKNYGIMSYKVRTFRNLHKFSQILPEKSFGIKHEPEKNNYSHCELYAINIQVDHKRRDRKNRREFRHILSRHWNKKLNPLEEPNTKDIFNYFIILILHKISLHFIRIIKKK